MTRSLLLIFAAALASSSSLLAQNHSDPALPPGGSQPVDRTSQTEDIKFKTELNQRMTVPVTLSGRGPYRFLVDTGANRTAISRQLASTLNLAAGPGARLHTVTGDSDVSTATLPDLKLTRKAVKMIDAPLLEDQNMGADGILGTDALASQRVLFDFQAQTMAIVPAGSPDFRDEPGTIVVEGRRRNGRLVVTDATANGHNLIVVVDTGSQVTIGNQALRNILQRGDLLAETHPVDLMSVTGEKITGDYMFLRHLEIGGIVLENLALVFAPARTFDQLKLNTKPALLLGMNAMRAFKKVSIDFANVRLRVILPQTSEANVQLAGDFTTRPVSRGNYR